MKLMLTGVTGFVGRAVLTRLSNNSEHQLCAAVRRQVSGLPADVVVVGNIGLSTNWSPFLSGVEAVVHMAARTHVTDDRARDPLAEFRAINVQGTLNLARQAAGAGVRRFIFVSSVKVNGEATFPGAPFRPTDLPAPRDAYGISKHEAEDRLRQLASDSAMDVTIIRPVLIYGPGVKANFLAMMHWLHKGIPLPLGAINNARSLVALDNLVDLIVTCLHHPAAANQTFLVSDCEDLSTTELLRRTAAAIGKKARLIPVPAQMLQFGARVLGKQHIAQRLCGSLQVDITKTRELLGWTPPVTVTQALQKTAEYFIQHQAR